MPLPIYVNNDQPQQCVFHYYDESDSTRRRMLEAAWQRFSRRDPATNYTYAIKTRPTSYQMEVSADYLLPANTPAGRYRIETFIPGKYATTRRAIFSLAHNFRMEEGRLHHDEAVVVVDMSDQYDTWYTLGEVNVALNTSAESGRVRQYSLSNEDPPQMVSFGPVRWLALDRNPGAVDVQFDSPVGTESERDDKYPAGKVMYQRYPIWTGEWFDVNPFLSWYSYGYHTGADLNLPGSSGADKGQPVFSMGDGTVTYAGKAGTWGSIVVVQHPQARVRLPDGSLDDRSILSRYGHVDDIRVRVGQDVKRGQLLAHIGLAAGAVSGWHLHFDICYTDLLQHRPASWPSMSTVRSLQMAGRRETREYASAQAALKKEVISHYLDPLKFIQENHP